MPHAQLLLPGNSLVRRRLRTQDKARDATPSQTLKTCHTRRLHANFGHLRPVPAECERRASGSAGWCCPAWRCVGFSVLRVDGAAHKARGRDGDGEALAVHDDVRSCACEKSAERADRRRPSAGRCAQREPSRCGVAVSSTRRGLAGSGLAGGSDAEHAAEGSHGGRVCTDEGDRRRAKPGSGGLRDGAVVSGSISRRIHSYARCAFDVLEREGRRGRNQGKKERAVVPRISFHMTSSASPRTSRAH